MDTPPNIDAEAAAARSQRPLAPGIYVPLLAFFTPDLSTIDIPTTQRHAARIASSGVSGLVVHGSNGEAPHLSRAERNAITSAVVDAVRTDADHSIPVIAGCGAQSVSETLTLCHDAAKAGASHALVLPPGYYANLMSRKNICSFFRYVSNASPIPVLVYNFPYAANGVDLDSDTLLQIAEECPNVVGVKLTCGNTGKLARVAHAVNSRRKGEFLVAGGSADFILQGAVAGAQGSISGLANLAPRACIRILELLAKGDLKAARDLQGKVAAADWLAIRYGLVGVKAALPLFDKFAESTKMCFEPRQPLEGLGKEPMEEVRRGMEELIGVEAELEVEAAGKSGDTAA